jgi:hypothetical protein
VETTAVICVAVLTELRKEILNAPNARSASMLMPTRMILNAIFARKKVSFLTTCALSVIVYGSGVDGVKGTLPRKALLQKIDALNPRSSS